jgi:predicted dehydrogenase
MAKIGIMSFAHMHAYSYAACLNALEDHALGAVWDDNRRRGRQAAEQFGAPFISDVNDFLDAEIDGVIICSENEKHLAMADVAASAGKWILCEKPLAPKVRDALAMVKLCQRAGVGLGTAFPCRHAPALIEAKRRLDAGELGEIYAVSCTNHGQCPGGWFANEALSGGGATMDHTVHVADLLRWMLGREFTKVYCELGNQLHPHEIKTDDLGVLHLEMEGGVQITHVASWSRPKTFPTWGDVTMEFIGEKGVMAVDAFNQKLDVFDDTNRRYAWEPWGDNPDLGLVADFCAAVDARREPGITGVDGLRAVEVTVAAYRAAKSKKAASIDRLVC